MKMIPDPGPTGPEHAQSCCCSSCSAVNSEERGAQSQGAQSFQDSPVSQNSLAAAEQLPQWGVLASDAHDEIADYIDIADWYFPIQPGGEITVNVTSLTAGGQQLARWALAAWESVANLTFREVADNATITFLDDYAGGWVTHVDSDGGGFIAANVNVDQMLLRNNGHRLGSETFNIYLHEIGHALGLGHTGDYNTVATYELDSLYEADSYQTSVMSYFEQGENPNIDASFAYPVTPMMADILAIQKKYGAPETNPGDTAYGYQSNVGGYLGQVFAAITEQEGRLHGPVTLTLFDSGGEDRLDLRTDEADQRVDLRPEGVSDVYGLTGNWLIARGTVIENLVAGQGDDQVIANAAANELDGGPGSDTVLYVGSDTGVRVDLDAGTGAGGHAAGDTLVNFEHVVGSAHDDRLRGDNNANHLWGRAGDDKLVGFSGADRLYGEAGADRLHGGGGDDVLEGGAGADRVTGGDGNDTASYADSNAGVRVDLRTGLVSGGHAAGDSLTNIENVIGSAHDDALQGDAGANTLEGGAGADTLDGGGGRDTVSYADSDAGVWVDLRTGAVSGGHAEGDSLTSIENVIGSAHDDALQGDAGANTLEGGAGNDTVSYADSNAGVRVGLRTGLVSGGHAEGDSLTSIENVIGSAHDDELQGDAGANRLTGGAGADALDGGAGNDTVSYVDSNARVRVDLHTGAVSGGHAVGDTFNSIENVIGSAHDDELRGDNNANALWGRAGDDKLVGLSGDDRLYGEAGADRLYGSAGDDVLEGGAGADMLHGEGGNDSVSYRSSNAGVRVDLGGGTVSGGHAEGDSLRSIENLIGSAHDDALQGDAGANRLAGAGGDDTLEGGDGADTLDGGAGRDTVSYAGSDAAVQVDLGIFAVSGGHAEGDRLRGIENIIGSAYDDELRGDWDDDDIRGGAGNDKLVGQTGNDRLYGEAGADQLYGSSGHDVLEGGAGADVLDGEAGADVLDGGAGDDTVSYSSSNVGVQVNLDSGAVSGGHAVGDTFNSIENVIGSAHGDALQGDAGANRLTGAGGNDTLEGGAGADTLDGGAGADTFVYTAASHSAAANTDQILNFSGVGGEGDRLDLSGLGNNSLVFIDTEGFTGTAGEVRYVQRGADTGDDYTDVLVDLNGNGAADFKVTLAGLHTLEGADLVGVRGRGVSLVGTPAADELRGGVGDDTLRGEDGDDTLEGGGGADILDGGAGRDTVSYVGSQAGVRVDIGTGVVSGGHAAGDTFNSIENIIGSAHDDELRGDNNDNDIWGRAGNDKLVGLSGDDRLYGEAGADQLYGSGGNDVLEGGAGADALHGEGGDDTVSYRSSNAGVQVNLGSGVVSGGHAAGDTFNSIENLIGSAHGDALQGAVGANRLTGAGGDDTLEGGAGADTLDGGAGADTFVYRAASDSTAANTDSILNFSGVGGEGDRLDLSGLGSGLVFIGTQGFSGTAGEVRYAQRGADTGAVSDDFTDVLADLDGDGAADFKVTLAGLYALDGADFVGVQVREVRDVRDVNVPLVGTPAADELRGGDGTDTVSYAGSDAGVQVDLRSGAVLGGHAAGDTLISIENLIGSAYDDELRGDNNANALWGRAGDDKLVGLSGDDRLYGEAGDDRLYGNDGDDVLTGGAGADELHGGGGDDTVSYEGSNAGVQIELAWSWSGSYGHAEGDTFSSIENVIGSGYDDSIRGDDGANRLEGRAGADRLYGWDGNDVLEGGDGDDALIGGADADRLSGGAGADTFVYRGAPRGMALGSTAMNADHILDFSGVGGDGDRLHLDLHYYHYGTYDDLTFIGTAAFTHTAGEVRYVQRGADTGADFTDVLVDLDGDGAADDFKVTLVGPHTLKVADFVEVRADLIGTADADELRGGGRADILRGEGGADTLWGEGGADLLEGGAGADTLDGGAGTDTVSYAGSGAGVRVDLGTAGTVSGGHAAGDTLRSIENVIGSAHNDELRGDNNANALWGRAGDDKLEGLSGDDRLYGEAGADRLYGGGGNDVLEGGAGADVLDGGAGTDTVSYAGSDAPVQVNLGTGAVSGGHADGDTLTSIENLIGSAHGDVLQGAAGANRLTGKGGDDTLEGGGGADILDGGAGADTFVYRAASDLTAATDQILDFSGTGGDGDRLDLSGLGSGLVFIGTQGFSDTAGEVRYVRRGADTKFVRSDDYTDVLVDLNGNAAADFKVTLAGLHTLDGADLVGVQVGVVGASLVGTPGADELLGDNNANAIWGRAGNDKLEGLSGADRLYGEAGDDRLYGGSGNDVLTGGAGADVLDGGGGDDTVSYEGSNEGVEVQFDYPRQGEGRAYLGHAAGDKLKSIENVIGSEHDDALYGGDGANRLEGRAGNDRLYGFDGNDTLEGGAGRDRLSGGDDDDVLEGGSGADALDGDAGTDTISYAGSDAAVWVSLGSGVVWGGHAEGDTLSSIENVIGSAYEDELRGDDNASYLWGRAGNDKLMGFSGDDWLYGEAGDDRLSGGYGNDVLEGGGGADTLDGGVGTDTVSYADSDAAVQVNLGGGAVSGGHAGGDTLRSIENVIGSAHGDALQGAAGANRLDGGGGDDTLEGGDGADTLDGGAGADSFVYRAASDSTVANTDHILDFSGAGGDGDRLDLSGLGNDLVFIGTADFTGTAGEVRYAQRGADTGADVSDDYTDVLADLDGNGAADFKVTLDGLHTLEVADLVGVRVREVREVRDVNAPLVGTPAADELRGGDGDDTLRGEGGDDVLEGGDGADTLDGGAGSDTASYAGSGAGVRVDLGNGVVSGGHAVGDTFNSIENVIGSAHDDELRGDNNANALWGRAGDDKLVGLSGDDRLYGEAGADRLFGSAGDDVLEGGAGADMLHGEGGNDSVSYRSSNAGVRVDLGGGTVSGGHAEGDSLRSIENVIGSAHDDELQGATGDNWLVGGGGDDTLEGGGGADTLDGGAGADSFVYNAASASTTTNADQILGFSGAGGEGDRLDLSGLGNGLVFIGTQDFTGTAGEVRHVRRGANTGSNTNDDYTDVLADLNGNGAADFKVTLDGLHTLEVADLVGVQVRDVNAPLVGTPAADELRGGDGDDTLRGEGGDDVLEGGDGADTLDGGAGSDTASYAGSGAGVRVDLGNGVVLGGHAAGDTLNSIENVIGSAYDDELRGDAGNNRLTGEAGADRLYGSGGHDVLVGGAGDDELHGQGGADVLQGGAGNDVLHGQGWNDLIEGGAGADTLDGGAGSDTVSYRSSNAAVQVDLGTGTVSGGHAAGDTLSRIENVTGSMHDDKLQGAAGANRLAGAGGNDTLEGGAGADTLDGGAGTDTVSYADSDAPVQVNLGGSAVSGGHAAGDTLRSIENLIGSAHDDALQGAAGDNWLVGGGGDDTLEGGVGADTLDGGAGADTFVYRAASDSTVANTDYILDFSGAGGDGDRLDLSGLGNGLVFIGTEDFTDTAGEVRYVRRGAAGSNTNDDYTDVLADLNGNGAADFKVTLDGLHTLEEADFVRDVPLVGTPGTDEVRYAQRGADAGADASDDFTDVLTDPDGDGAADFMVTLVGLHDLIAGDFLL